MSISRISDRPSPTARAAGAFASLLVLLLGVMASVPAAADEFPTVPILRQATRMHTAAVMRLDVDSKEQFLVSGSFDKTARVWDLETGRMLRILRVPISGAHVGKVYGVAISPDGDTVAVGGHTGHWTGEQIIYIFDRAEGKIRHNITELHYAVNHLVFSKDGRYLAAVSGGDSGLRVYETKEYRLEAEDNEYAGSSYWADFDAAGRLVTVSYDDNVRLYSAEFELLRKEPAPATHPFSAVFSPDGRYIAVGYSKSTDVDVLRSDDLLLMFSADTDTIFNGNLARTAWSRDGSYLYAGGRYTVGRLIQMLRWSDAGRGERVEFEVSRDTIMHILPLRNGRVAVGAGDPKISVLDPNGQVIWEQRSNIVDFRNIDLSVSKNGHTVQFNAETFGERPARFSIDELNLDLNPPEPDDLLGPAIWASGIEITDWLNLESPKLNGRTLKIFPGERSRGLAIAPDEQQFLLGFDWTIRLFDLDGNELWYVDTPDITWGVNVSGDGRYAVAAYGDGTIRWYRMTDGQELLALALNGDGRRWIMWTPLGYYNASAGAEDLIGWHVNRGIDEAPQFFGASRFRDQFYRPDVLAHVLETQDVEKAVQLADKERGQKSVFKSVKSILPPTITILAPASGTFVESTKLTLTYTAEAPTGPILSIDARVDGRPAKVLSHQPKYFEDAKNSMLGQITIEVPTQNTTIALIARNEHGTSEPATFVSNWAGEADWFKPNLYVLAVGVSKYSQEHLVLDYAAKDAEDFVAAIKTQEGGLYKKVTSLTLTDEEATKVAILDGLDWLQRETTSRDVAMIFISGHGVNGPQGNYHFLPQDVELDRLRRTAIRKSEFKDFLSVINGRPTAMFFDTCYSGNVLTGVRPASQQADVDKFANELADADSGVIMFSSSTGKQFSVEDEKWENGAFTEALVEGILGKKADFTGDNFVTIAEIEVYLSDRVKELTKGAQTPVTAKPEVAPDYRIVRVDTS